MITASAAIERLRAFQRESMIPRWRWQQLAGLGRGDTLRDIASPDWNPRRETMERLESVIPAGWMPGDPIPEELRGPGAPSPASPT